MAYSKTTWVNNSAPAINDTNLNHIETGVDEAHDSIENTSTGHAHTGVDSKSITGHLGPNAKSDSVQAIQEQGFKLEYNPSHPKADENGFIKMPNVNPIEEMVDLVAATRTYEANVTVLNAAKQMAQKALEI